MEINGYIHTDLCILKPIDIILSLLFVLLLNTGVLFWNIEYSRMCWIIISKLLKHHLKAKHKVPGWFSEG